MYILMLYDMTFIFHIWDILLFCFTLADGFISSPLDPQKGLSTHCWTRKLNLLGVKTRRGTAESGDEYSQEMNTGHFWQVLYIWKGFHRWWFIPWPLQIKIQTEWLANV